MVPYTGAGCMGPQNPAPFPTTVPRPDPSPHAVPHPTLSPPCMQVRPDSKINEDCAHFCLGSVSDVWAELFLDMLSRRQHKRM